jgi:hypothetical protein
MVAIQLQLLIESVLHLQELARATGARHRAQQRERLHSVPAFPSQTTYNRSATCIATLDGRALPQTPTAG